MVVLKVLLFVALLFELLYAFACTPFGYARLLAFYRARSHVLAGYEPYGNSYTFVLLRALDLNGASLVWRNYGVTISSMTGLAMRPALPPAWAVALGAFLVLCQRNHCEEAVVADRLRAKQAQAVLDGTA